MQDAFIDFSKKLKSGGLLVSKSGLSKESRFEASNHLKYSLDIDTADVHASNILMHQGSYKFDVRIKGWRLSEIVLNMGGRHNVENALVAIAVAHHLGIEDEKIKDAISAFKGVKRRFEYVMKQPSFVFIDDYAHHPQELRALITGAKSLFDGMKCTIIFQPHLYTRTRDFADGFADVLDMADEVILLPIYPARELPIDGVTSEMILSRMSSAGRKVLSKNEVLNYIKDEYMKNFDLKPGHVLIMAGAGDIDAMVQPVKDIIERTHPGL
jgi:UDP-N-acetylmuramate--alanine ligase